MFTFQGTPVRREIPVFGAPFGFDVFILGMIDEIRVDAQTFDFDLLEFKTRSTSRSLPSKAQRSVHNLQVNMPACFLPPAYQLRGKVMFSVCPPGGRGYPTRNRVPLPPARTRTGYSLCPTPAHITPPPSQDQDRVLPLPHPKPGPGQGTPAPWPGPGVYPRPPPLFRTRTGYPLLQPSQPGPGQGAPPHPLPQAGNVMNRIRRGPYASCVFTQEDFLVCTVVNLGVL